MTVDATFQRYYGNCRSKNVDGHFKKEFCQHEPCIFGPDRIYWECNETALNKYLPHGFPESGKTLETVVGDIDKLWIRSLPEVVLDPSRESWSETDIFSLHLVWRSLVESYSGRALTFPNKDKLVAIGAVAKRLGRAPMVKYVAGLFMGDIPMSLLWRYNPSQGTPSPIATARLADLQRKRNGWIERFSFDQSRQSRYRAPSW